MASSGFGIELPVTTRLRGGVVTEGMVFGNRVLEIITLALPRPLTLITFIRYFDIGVVGFLTSGQVKKVKLLERSGWRSLNAFGQPANGRVLRATQP